MDEQAARALARDLIRPCGLLGYLVGTGDWWRSESRLKLGKRAVGSVMGRTYLLLAPVWHVYPALDPAQVHDPLGLADQSTSLRDTPEDLGSLLRDLERAVARASPVLAEHFPASLEQVQQAASDVIVSIREAEEVLRATELA